ncbi:response regulator [Roseibium hamelinense]|uniref:response regulator n=1 Tax=Roseibium hamelinense TaxID=150831 RepID=UPI0011A3A206|nr:response regulator [Roseibium hamelinense]MTI42431.1 response regulator [Roseibium hamelinense]
MFIHIIEDDYAVADSLALLLEDFGHEVKCYPDAETFFEQGPPNAEDCVVVDIGLPGVTGDEVINWLRGLATPPGIMVMSGKSKTLLERSKLDLKSLTVLRKPLSMRAIAEHFGPSEATAAYP